MSKFVIGQKVVVIVEERNGQIGEVIYVATIQNLASNHTYWENEIMFSDGYALCFDDDELELAPAEAPAAPTPDAGAARPYAYADLVKFYELMVSLDAQNETIEKLAATMYEDQYDLDAWAELTVVCERLHDARKAATPPAPDTGK